MTQTHLPPQWEKRVLAGINGHGWNKGVFYPQGLRLLSAWETAEGGYAQWNPLNTTYKLWNSFDYNTNAPPVQNYKRASEGVAATVLTLVNGYYPGILGDLENAVKTAEQIVHDRWVQFQKWGTAPETIIRVLSVTPLS